MFKKLKSKVKSTITDIQKPQQKKEEEIDTNEIEQIYWDKDLIVHLKAIMSDPKAQIS